MKKFIYLSAAVFVVASFYGFKDYLSAKKSGLFKTLYVEQKDVPLLANSSREFDEEDFSRGEPGPKPYSKEIKENKKEDSLDFSKINLEITALPPKVTLSSFSRGKLIPIVRNEEINIKPKADSIIIKTPLPEQDSIPLLDSTITEEIKFEE